MGYSSISVFDFVIYDYYESKDNYFKLDTVKSFYFYYDSGELYLEIEDSLFNFNFTEDICSGKYHNKYLKIEGYGTFRNADDDKDYDVKMTITHATLKLYEITQHIMEPTRIRIKFNVPMKDLYGLNNISYKVVDKCLIK